MCPANASDSASASALPIDRAVAAVCSKMFLASLKVAVVVHRFGERDLCLQQIGGIPDVVRQHLHAQLQEFRNGDGGLAGVVGVGKTKELMHEGLHLLRALRLAQCLLLAPCRVADAADQECSGEARPR